MGRLVTLTLAMALWIVLWSLGSTAFTAILLPSMIVLVAAAVHTYKPLMSSPKKK